MSNSLDDYSEPVNPLIEADAWHSVLTVLYPTLADALLGNEHTRNGGPLRPPFTLMLRAKGGSVQAMLSNPDASKTWFSLALDPNDLLGAVEAQLAKKLGDWILKPRNGSGKKY